MNYAEMLIMSTFCEYWMKRNIRREDYTTVYELRFLRDLFERPDQFWIEYDDLQVTLYDITNLERGRSTLIWSNEGYSKLIEGC